LITTSKNIMIIILKAIDVKSSEVERSSAICLVEQMRQLDNLVISPKKYCIFIP